MALAAVLCLAGGLYLERPAAVEKVALRVEDAKVWLRGLLRAGPEPGGTVAVVAIDEPSVRRLGRWPWPPELVGALVARLREAELVGFALVLAEASGTSGDESLARALAAGGNAVLGYSLREAPGGAPPGAGSDPLEEYAYLAPTVRSPTVGVEEFEFAEMNPPGLTAGALSAGFLNAEPDVDGVYRRYPIAYVHRGHVLPSFAVQLAQHKLGRRAELVLDKSGVRAFALGRTRVLDRNSFELNFGDSAVVPVVSASDLLDGRVSPAAFRGKVALVGLTAPGTQGPGPAPLRSTPGGLFLHYTALSNLLETGVLRPSRLADLALLFVASLLVLAAGQWRRALVRTALYAGAFALVYGASLYALVAHRMALREFYVLAPALLLVALLEAIRAVERSTRRRRPGVASLSA